MTWPAVLAELSGRRDLSRDEADKDDGHDNEHRDQRRRTGVACKRAEQRAQRSESRPGDEQADTQQRQPCPGLAADDVAELHDRAEDERDDQTEHERNKRAQHLRVS